MSDLDRMSVHQYVAACDWMRDAQRELEAVSQP